MKTSEILYIGIGRRFWSLHKIHSEDGEVSLGRRKCALILRDLALHLKKKLFLLRLQLPMYSRQTYLSSESKVVIDKCPCVYHPTVPAGHKSKGND